MVSVVADREIDIKTCIYKEDSFSFIKVSVDLIGSYILSKAMYNCVLNLNALYKNFIDDNFEYHPEVQDHKIKETMLENGCLRLCMCALDELGQVFLSHTIEIKPT